jgi:hypothetical protein
VNYEKGQVARDRLGRVFEMARGRMSRGCD